MYKFQSIQHTLSARGNRTKPNTCFQIVTLLVIVCSTGCQSCSNSPSPSPKAPPSPKELTLEERKCLVAKQWMALAKKSAESGDFPAALHREQRAKELCKHQTITLPTPTETKSPPPNNWLDIAQTKRASGNLEAYRSMIRQGAYDKVENGKIPFTVQLAESYPQTMANQLIFDHELISKDKNSRYAILKHLFTDIAMARPYVHYPSSQRKYLWNPKNNWFESSYPTNYGCLQSWTNERLEFIAQPCSQQPTTIIRSKDGKVVHKVDASFDFVDFSPKQSGAFFHEGSKWEPVKHVVHYYPLKPGERAWSVSFEQLFPKEKSNESIKVSFFDDTGYCLIEWDHRHLSVHELKSGKYITNIALPREIKFFQSGIHSRWFYTFPDKTGSIFVWDSKSMKSKRISFAKTITLLPNQKIGEEVVDFVFHPREPWMIVGSASKDRMLGKIDLESGTVSRFANTGKKEFRFPVAWIGKKDSFLFGDVSYEPKWIERGNPRAIGISNLEGETKILFSSNYKKRPMLLKIDQKSSQFTFLNQDSWELVTTRISSDGQLPFVDVRKLSGFTDQGEVKGNWGERLTVVDNGKLHLFNWQNNQIELSLQKKDENWKKLAEIVLSGSVKELKYYSPADGVSPRNLRLATIIPETIQWDSSGIRYSVKEDPHPRVWDLGAGKLSQLPTNSSSKRDDGYKIYIQTAHPNLANRFVHIRN
jgi:hypothetical protein